MLYVDLTADCLSVCFWSVLQGDTEVNVKEGSQPCSWASSKLNVGASPVALYSSVSIQCRVTSFQLRVGNHIEGYSSPEKAKTVDWEVTLGNVLFSLPAARHRGRALDCCPAGCVLGAS